MVIKVAVFLLQGLMLNGYHCLFIDKLRSQLKFRIAAIKKKKKGAIPNPNLKLSAIHTAHAKNNRMAMSCFVSVFILQVY
jgi:hypothetical protein